MKLAVEMACMQVLTLVSIIQFISTVKGTTLTLQSKLFLPLSVVFLTLSYESHEPRPALPFLLLAALLPENTSTQRVEVNIEHNNQTVLKCPNIHNHLTDKACKPE